MNSELSLITNEIKEISEKPIIETIDDVEKILKKIEDVCRKHRQDVVILLKFVLSNKFPSMFSDKRRKLEENLKVLSKNKKTTLAYQKAFENTFTIFEEAIDIVREAIYVVKTFKNCLCS